MPTDQQTRRRSTVTGVTLHDPELACPGYVLYTPMYSPGHVDLIDLKGEVAHRWEMPHPPGLYGYLLPNGNLFYLGKTHDETWDRFPSWKRFKGGVMMEVDWDGNVVWEHRDPDHHHDARRTESGGAIYMTVEKMPDDLAANVKGGLPIEGGMWTDVLVEVDSSGNRIWEWHSSEHLDTETDVLTYCDMRDEWAHGNTIVSLSGDRVMVSFRNISTVGIIDKKSGEWTWRLDYNTLAQQHDPSMLDNGNVLIYDNGTHRKSHPMPHSRVIEVSTSNSEIVWSYTDTPLYNFFSPYISGARRLPNGNTLITEGMFGRIFQVTPDKQVAWEYINPHFFEAPDVGITNQVFRSNHYLPEQIPNLR